MSSTSAMSVRRGDTILELRKIRESAREALLTISPRLIGSEWQRDRIRDLEWSSKRLAAMAVLSALAE